MGVITRLEAFLYSLNQNEVNGTTPAAMEQSMQDGKPAALLPELGIYTELLRREIPEGIDIRQAEPLRQHRSFNYAINKKRQNISLTFAMRK